MSDYPSMAHVQNITFEGCDCVVMSPEEYGATLADLEAKDHELDRLRAANARLQAWHDAVMAQKTVGTYYTSINRRQWFPGKTPFASIPYPAIIRPQPLAKE